MAAAPGPRSLRRDAEEETRSDPELGSGTAWPRLPHHRYQRSGIGRRCRTFGRAEAIRRRCEERWLMPQDSLDRIREALTRLPTCNRAELTAEWLRLYRTQPPARLA